MLFLYLKEQEKERALAAFILFVVAAFAGLFVTNFSNISKMILALLLIVILAIFWWPPVKPIETFLGLGPLSKRYRLRRFLKTGKFVMGIFIFAIAIVLLAWSII